MKSLQIRIFPLEGSEPKKTITIPGMMLGFAPKLLPAHMAAALREKGIDVKEVVNLAKQPEVSGKIVEIEDHEGGERIVVSLV